MVQYNIGERVTITQQGHGLRLGTVLRVTPTGRIVVKLEDARGEMTFRPDGSLYGASWWSFGRVEKLTQKALDEYEFAKLHAYLNQTQWGELALPVLRSVCAIVKEAVKDDTV